ncbi:NHLP family bacteriocin export ABC transporter peptidase/permease/ATPase subunit [Fundidesulfovibrio butyratiphilus]
MTPSAPWSETRVKTPTILQMEATECGCASLAMVMAHHGRYVPLEALRHETGVSRDGSKASNLLKAARHYGFEAAGYRAETEDLNQYPLPMILHWGFDHFVVLEGIKNKTAYLNDPATGPRRLPLAEFDTWFTGIVLTVVPGPGFQPGGEKPDLFANLGRRLASSGRPLACILLAGTLLALTGILGPAFNIVFLDHVIGRNMAEWMPPLLWAMGLTAAASGVLRFIQAGELLRLHLGMALAGSGRFFWHVLRLPVDFFSQRFAGDIGSRVRINDSVAGLLTGPLANATVGVMNMVLFALVMLCYNVWLTAIGLILAAANLAALRLVSARRTDANRRLKQENGKLIGVTMNGLQIIETLKATGTESDYFAKWAGYQAKVVNAGQELNYASQMLSVVPVILTGINQMALLCLGGLFIIKGNMTIGMLTAFQGLMGNFMEPVNQLVGLGGQFQTVRADLERLEDVIDNPIDPALEAADTQGDLPDECPAKLSGRFEMRNVTFGYSPLDPPLIEDFNLILEPGARVALVGASGSGKSTIAKLGAGLYAPWSGEILYDGKPLRDIPKRVITNSVSSVDQSVFLFAGTVRENMTMWDTTLADTDMLAAARDACIHDDVAARPGGYQSRVEENGANFSGGQRQRLEIARALAVNPSLLFLDEATSALDSITERRVGDSIRRRGCACVVSAHRLSAIRDCDAIILLDRGKVLQRGTHEELSNVDGPYRELIRNQ